MKEEVGLEIEKPRYLCDLVFVRPNGYPVATLSYFAKYKSGEVRISKDFTDFVWVSGGEVQSYDLIEGIGDEIREVAKTLGV